LVPIENIFADQDLQYSKLVIALVLLLELQLNQYGTLLQHQLLPEVASF
jgi:hypothetical protein